MPETILLTGATGFIGHHLQPRLLAEGHHVRAVSRQPRAADFPPHERLDFVKADLLDPAGLQDAFVGVDAAFYLVHSMEGGVGQDRDFVERDKRAARNFARCAEAAGVRQTIYLSGLKPPGEGSAHLKSRREVERILAESDVALTVLRAGFIIGDGSAGCVMLDALTKTMDTLLVVPEFHNATQPAFVDDVVEALVCCLSHRDDTAEETFEVGSTERVSYRDLIAMYADYSGRDLELLEVPWAPRSIGAAWIAAISELPYSLIRASERGPDDRPLRAKRASVRHLFAAAHLAKGGDSAGGGRPRGARCGRGRAWQRRAPAAWLNHIRFVRTVSRLSQEA